MSRATFPVLPSAQAATSAGDIFAAVMLLWDEAFKAIFRDRLPPTVNPADIGHPYVIVSPGASRRTWRSAKGEGWESLVTFKVYHATHEKAEEAMALIGDVFDDGEKDLDFYLQPEGQSQSSGGNFGSESQSGDTAPPAGNTLLCDRLNEGFGEEDRVVRFAWLTYRIQRRKRRRNPS
jgi:hypothetical protein